MVEGDPCSEVVVSGIFTMQAPRGKSPTIYWKAPFIGRVVTRAVGTSYGVAGKEWRGAIMGKAGWRCEKRRRGNGLMEVRRDERGLRPSLDSRVILQRLNIDDI